MAEVVLGVDGGGTKTHFGLATRDGELRAFVPGPGSNHEWRGMKPIRGIFAAMTARACRQAGVRPLDIKAATFGQCGCDLAEDRDELERHAILPAGITCPLMVHNDAFIALFNDRWRDEGVVVTAGGWTKWLGVKGKRTFMHDAFRHRGIRQLGIDLLTDVAEGYRENDAFSRAFLRHLGFSSPHDFLARYIFGREKRDFVGRIPRGCEARVHRIPVWLGKRAARGDRGALALLDGYAGELADGVGAVVRVLGLARARFEVVFSGSVLAGIPALRRRTARRIGKFAPRARCVGAPARPVRGALVHAAHEAWGGFRPKARGRVLLEPELWYGPKPSTAAY